MKNLTEGNIYKNFFVFAIPLILAGLLSSAYGTIDNVIAGKFLGQEGLAATGSTSQAVRFFACIFYGMSVGFGMYIAKIFGSKKYALLKPAIFSVTLVVLGIIIVSCVLIVLLHRPILKILNVAEDIYVDSAIYFCIYIGGFAIIFLNHYFMCIFNAIGLSVYPLIASVISGILNIVGNIVSITLLHMGVTGIALASIFAALIVDIVYIVKLYFCLKELETERAGLFFDKSAVKGFIKYGMPSSFQQSVMYISSVIVSAIVNSMGVSATASYNVVMRVYDIIAGIYQNASRTLANYAAQCFGSRQYKKLAKGLIVGLPQELLFTVPLIVLCAVFARPLTLMFFPKGFEGEAIDYAIIFIRFYLPFIVFNLICNLFHGFFRGISYMNIATVSTLLASVVRIIASLALVRAFMIEGVYAGWVVSWLVEAAFATFIYVKYFSTGDKLEKRLENVE